MTSPKRFPVRRDNLYRIKGLSLPSATTVCGAFPKPFLVPWAAKMGAKAVLDDPERYNTAEKAAAAVSGIKEAAAERGKIVHAVVEAWAKGADLDTYVVPDEYQGYKRAIAGFVRTCGPTPLHVEVIVYNLTHGYAGQADLIAKIGGEVWLLDFKTSKTVYPDYRLQLAAYKNAEFMLRRDDPTEYPMPEIDQTGVVLLRPNGTYDLVVTDAPFEAFLALKVVYEYARSEGEGG